MKTTLLATFLVLSSCSFAAAYEIGKSYKRGPLEWAVSGIDYTNVADVAADQVYLQVSLRTDADDTIAFRVSVTFEACGKIQTKTSFAQRKPDDFDPFSAWTNVWFKTSCRVELRSVRIQEIKEEVEVDYLNRIN